MCNIDFYGYDFMLLDYLVLLDYLKVQKVDFVGWSDGGIIGFDIVIYYFERLDKFFVQVVNIKVEGVKLDVMENKIFVVYIDCSGEVYKKIFLMLNEYDVFVKQISDMWVSQLNWFDSDL